MPSKYGRVVGRWSSILSNANMLNLPKKRTKGAKNNHIHNETDIPKTKGVKYLGLRLESSLRWNENFNYITNKAASIR